MGLPTPPSKLALDRRTYRQAQLCVHCGLCLPACPTYTENGLEADSPRGRIYLMKALADGRIEPTAAVQKHLDLCLDCRACETACPSAVQYHELIEQTRARLRPVRRASPGERFVDWVGFHLLTHPLRLKLAILPARLLQRVRLFGPLAKAAAALLGPRVAKMQQMLPQRGPLWQTNLAEEYPPTRPSPDGRTRTVGLLAGCVGSVLFQDVNRRTVELLQHLGCRVLAPRGQGCCGAIHHHGGRPQVAAERAKRNIDAFENCDYVVTNIAGCGAMLKEYDHLLRDDPQWADRARSFSNKTRDICQFIAELNPPAPTHRVSMRATYHDACHLAHGQKITKQPRRLLESIRGLQLVPLTESDMCCGAAGTYNLQQPQMARSLAARKLKHLRQTGCDVCVTGNVGCAMQIQSEAAAAGIPLTVAHPVDLLHQAYLGPPSRSSWAADADRDQGD